MRKLVEGIRKWYTESKEIRMRVTKVTDFYVQVEKIFFVAVSFSFNRTLFYSFLLLRNEASLDINMT